MHVHIPDKALLIAIGLALYLFLVYLLLKVLARVTCPVAHSGTLALTRANEKGEAMPLTLEVGQQGVARLHEWSSTTPGQGSEVTGPGPVAYESGNVAVAAVDSSSGAIVAVALGTATIKGTDSGDGISAFDSLTVVAPTPKSGSLELAAVPAP